MARRKTNPIEKVAAVLVDGNPLDYAQRADGTLVVIGPEGRKVIFTVAEVRKAVAKEKAEATK